MSQKYIVILTVLNLDELQQEDVEWVLAIREKDALQVENNFVEANERQRAETLPEVFQKALAYYQITIDDLRNYNTASVSYLVTAMRGVRLSVYEISAITGIVHGNLWSYLRGKSTLRDKNMAKIEAEIRARMSKKQKELDSYFAKLYFSLKIERAMLLLTKKQVKLPSSVEESIQRVLNIREKALQLAPYGVTPKDIKLYRRTSYTVFKEIMEVAEMDAHEIAIASNVGKTTFADFLKKRRLFIEETMRRLENFLKHQAQQNKQLFPLKIELRRAFHVERAAKNISKNNTDPTPVQQELLNLVDEAI